MKKSVLEAIQSLKTNGIIIKSGRIFGRDVSFSNIDVVAVVNKVKEFVGVDIKPIVIQLSDDINEYDLLISQESHQVFPHVNQQLLKRISVQKIMTGFARTR